MAREPVTQTIFGSKVTTQPLPGGRAAAKLPVVIEILTLGASGFGKLLAVSEDPTPAELAAALTGIDGAQARRCLELVLELAPEVLVTTVAIVDGQKYELMNDEHREALLDARPDLYLPIVLFAGRVTYQRFFPGAGRRAAETPTASS